MKYFVYKVTFYVLLRLPDFFYSALFVILFPIYKALHKKRAYGRVETHLASTGLNSKTTAKEVFRSIYWNGIDCYRILARIPSATKRVRFENEQIIQDALHQGPVVAMSIHQGAFECLHRSLCRYSESVHLITNTSVDKDLKKLIHQWRKDKHLQEYDTDQVSTVIRNLFKTKGILAMVVDQAHNTRGNTIQLFGIPSTLFLRLPLKANAMGAAIVTFRTWSQWTSNSRGKKIREHVVRFEKNYAPQSASTPEDESKLILEIGKEVESWIQDHPEQWPWNYHRNFTT